MTSAHLLTASCPLCDKAVQQAHGTRLLATCCLMPRPGAKRKKKASGSCDPCTELFPGEARGQGREEYLMQHGSPTVLRCHRSWPDSSAMCIWGFRVTSGCQNSTQPGRKSKKSISGLNFPFTAMAKWWQDLTQALFMAWSCRRCHGFWTTTSKWFVSWSQLLQHVSLLYWQAILR